MYKVTAKGDLAGALDLIVDDWDVACIEIGRHIERTFNPETVQIRSTGDGVLLLNDNYLVAEYSIKYTDNNTHVATKLRHHDN